MNVSSENFHVKLARLLARAEGMGFVAVDVRAGNLHPLIGGYPDTGHRMPVCCSAMRQAMRKGDQVVAKPASRMGASLTVRYCLPRKSLL